MRKNYDTLLAELRAIYEEKGGDPAAIRDLARGLVGGCRIDDDEAPAPLEERPALLAALGEKRFAEACDRIGNFKADLDALWSKAMALAADFPEYPAFMRDALWLAAMWPEVCRQDMALDLDYEGD